MSYESMIQAAIQAVRQRSVIRPSLDDLAKAAVDAAIATMEKVGSFEFDDYGNLAIEVDEPGVYAVVRIGETDG